MTQSAWCPTCRTRREVMDTYWTDTGDGTSPTVEYLAQPLECGHDANDGGSTASQRRPRLDPTLVDQVAALQRGQR